MLVVVQYTDVCEWQCIGLKHEFFQPVLSPLLDPIAQIPVFMFGKCRLRMRLIDSLIDVTRILKVFPKEFRPLIFNTVYLQLLWPNTGHENYFFSRTGNGYVQPVFSSGSIQATKLHIHFPLLIWSIADGKNDNIFFISLNIL